MKESRIVERPIEFCRLTIMDGIELERLSSLEGVGLFEAGGTVSIGGLTCFVQQSAE